MASEPHLLYYRDVVIFLDDSMKILEIEEGFVRFIQMNKSEDGIDILIYLLTLTDVTSYSDQRGRGWH